MSEETQVNTPPTVTIEDDKYLIDDLSDRGKVLVSDLYRTSMEYNELFRSYNQTLTLTNTYASGLKGEVEKANLPEKTEDSESSITIEDKSYDGSDLPDTVKAYINELVRANNNKSALEFRLRQLDAAKTTYISSLKDDISNSDIQSVE
tara:strand:- start:639 stop:1085 length:447 start_codon:yes stop_codon:yes gene_type:complete